MSEDVAKERRSRRGPPELVPHRVDPHARAEPNVVRRICGPSLRSRRSMVPREIETAIVTGRRYHDGGQMQDRPGPEIEASGPTRGTENRLDRRSASVTSRSMERYPSRRSPTARGGFVLDHGLINRTLGTAMRTGGEFAEVFVEDKRSSSAVLDDGRVEELTSGRDRGAGIRVVVGDTTGFAHTADLSEAGLATAAEAAAAKRPPGRGGGGVKEMAVTPGRRGVGRRAAIPPEDVAKATKVELLTSRQRGGPGRGGIHHPGVGPLRRQPAPHSRGQQRRPARRGRSGAHPVLRGRAWPPATPDCRPAGSQPGARSASSCSTRPMWRRWPAPRLAGRSRS